MSDEFQHLFQAAAKLKSHQLKSDRPKFERWPKYRQNSCFPKDDVLALRAQPHAPRLAGLRAIKEEGNELFRSGDVFGALARYESALSVVTYAVNAEPDWRNKSIKDSDLTEFDYDGGCEGTDASDDEEREEEKDEKGQDEGVQAAGGDEAGGRNGSIGTTPSSSSCSSTSTVTGASASASTSTSTRQREVVECKVSCYLNLAAAYLKIRDWSSAAAAATDAIALAPRSAKAYYRRALARLEPLSSGAAEVEQGFADLQKAAALDPANKTVARRLRRATAQQRAQRDRDRKHYSGFLHRTKQQPLYDDKVAAHEESAKQQGVAGGGSGSGGNDTNGGVVGAAATGRFGVPQAVEVQFRELEMMIRELEADGNYHKAKMFRDELAQAEEKVRRKALFADRPDFEHPTPELVAHAAESGIDLSDPVQRRLLVEMQRDQLSTEAEGGEVRQEGGGRGKGNGGEGGEAARRQRPEGNAEEEEAEKKKQQNALFWKTFWGVFALAVARIVYVVFIAAPTAPPLGGVALGSSGVGIGSPGQGAGSGGDHVAGSGGGRLGMFGDGWEAE